jgi:hypothetical protein
MLLAYENAAKGEERQAFCRVKEKKCNGHCRMLKKAHRQDSFIEDYSMNDGFC